MVTMPMGRAAACPKLSHFATTLVFCAALVNGSCCAGKRCVSVLMDVDTGSDDAMAIALASSLPTVCVEAVTVAAGNTNMSTAYDNTLKVLSTLNRTNIPVYKGTNQPIGSHWNSVSGYYASLGEPQGHAFLKMIELAKEGPVQTMIMLAPLTNVATALLVDPGFLSNVEQVYVMGGNLYGKGNALPGAEFNFFADPEAVRAFLERVTCPVTIIPWEACSEAKVPWDTYCSVASKRGRLQDFVRSMTADSYPHCPSGDDNSAGIVIGDFVAALAALVPDSVQNALVHRVDVELAGAYTRGQLVHAWESRMLPHVNRNVTIVERLDVSVVAKYFRDTFDPRD